MATTKNKQLRIDASRPFYAVVGAGDLVVEYARHAATDVQTRVKGVELEPKALRDQARTLVVSRVDELQAEAKALPSKAQALVNEYVADLNESVSELNEAYVDLAARGRTLVTRIRRQQATQDAKAAAGTTKAKAKTARTQTTKSAKKSTSTAKTAAKKTAGTARTNAKSTTTAAKKTAAATTDAVADGAAKVGD